MKLLDLFKTIIWAKNGDTTDFSQTNYEAGWAHLGDDTPTVQDFNYVQQMNDKKDQWLFNQLKTVMENAGIEPTEDNVNSLLNAILKISKTHSTPKTITSETVDFVDNTGHTHAITKASLEQAGIVQLTSDSETLGLTAKAGKTLKALIDALTRNLNNYIPNSKKSSATDSESEDTVATSKSVKKAYDRAIEAEGKGLPVGAVLAFPSAVQNPRGFLRCDGSTFGSSTYPDLYRALGNSNKLPDLRRSDVGMTAYFATDSIPDGWIAFDSIRTQVTQERYPELYRYLVAKYGSINAVPKAEDRFIRNIGSQLTVGQCQKATAGAVDTFGGSTLAGLFVAEDSNPDGRHIAKTRETIGGDDFVTDDYTLYKRATHEGLYAVWSSPNGDVINPDGTSDGASKDIVLYGMRPRAIALKLCIKAQNTFDDVQFWIKAFGTVTHAGELDAVQLAQDLRTHTHTASQITDFDNGVSQIINQSFSQSLTGNGWCRLPNGLLLQWGQFDANVSNGGKGICLYPIAFSTAIFVVVLGSTSGLAYGANSTEGFIVESQDLTKFSWISHWQSHGGVYNHPIQWMSIGY